MANPDFLSLFRTYPNRNAELRMVSRQAYEFGKTVAAEADSAMSAGMHEHAVARQVSYLDYIDKVISNKGYTRMVGRAKAERCPKMRMSDISCARPTGIFFSGNRLRLTSALRFASSIEASRRRRAKSRLTMATSL